MAQQWRAHMAANHCLWHSLVQAAKRAAKAAETAAKQKAREKKAAATAAKKAAAAEKKVCGWQQRMLDSQHLCQAHCMHC